MKPLSQKALNVIGLTGLFTMADAMCLVFMSVYFWVNSFDIQIICRFYLTIYVVTPFTFLLAGWYSQIRDRLHVYRAGLALHAFFYGVLLCLQSNAPRYPISLGVFFGVTSGIYWAGANTLNFDVTPKGNREYFYGIINAVTGIMGLIAPLLSGIIIQLAPTQRAGYIYVFCVVVCVYLACFFLSFSLPSDATKRPFHIQEALFPKKEQLDWRLAMWAHLSMTGSFSIFPIILSLLMYIKSNSEISVGVFASLQAFAVIGVSYFTGKCIVTGNRRFFLFLGTILLVLAGVVMLFPLTTLTLVIFGFLRSFSTPLFSIPYSGIRYDIISKCTGNTGQRIEYIAASEVPLALGRIFVMSLMMILFLSLNDHDTVLRIILFGLCLLRIVTYRLIIHTEALQEG